jgi:hypothetical protein
LALSKNAYFPPIGRRCTKDGPGHVGATGSNQAGDSQDLAAMGDEGHIFKQSPAGKPLNRKGYFV